MCLAFVAGAGQRADRHRPLVDDVDLVRPAVQGDLPASSRRSLAHDASRGALLIADPEDGFVFRATLATGFLDAVAGTGPSSGASEESGGGAVELPGLPVLDPGGPPLALETGLGDAFSIAVSGDLLFIADDDARQVYAVNLGSGPVTVPRLRRTLLQPFGEDQAVVLLPGRLTVLAGDAEGDLLSTTVTAAPMPGLSALLGELGEVACGPDGVVYLVETDGREKRAPVRVLAVNPTLARVTLRPIEEDLGQPPGPLGSPSTR